MEKLVSKPENNVEDKDLIPITQKDFEKFIKGKELKDGIIIRQEILRLCLDLSLWFLVNE